MAYRSTIHESTGYTPNRMMLGRELPMPSHLLVETPEQGEDTPTDSKLPFTTELEAKLHEAHEAARENLKKSHVHQKRQYDRKSTLKAWEVGKAVWLFNPTKQVGKSPKLMIFWEEEPYVITERVNDVVMKIQKNKKAKPRVVHVDRLKLVEGPIDTSWFTGKREKPGGVGEKPPDDTGQQPTGLEQRGVRISAPRRSRTDTQVMDRLAMDMRRRHDVERHAAKRTLGTSRGVTYVGRDT